MSFSTNKSRRNIHKIFQAFVIILNLLIWQNEASLLSEPINLPIGYYTDSDDLINSPYYGSGQQLNTDYDSFANDISIQQRDVSPSAALAASEGLEYLVDQTSPLSSSPQGTNYETLDARKLINFLNQVKQEDFATDDTLNDINLHLPASNVIDENNNDISEPVNDPVEFEATLSYLTNTLNHEIPNSINRSAMLDTLMPIYIGTIMKQMQHQPQKDADLLEGDKEQKQHKYLVGRVLTSDNDLDSDSDNDHNNNIEDNINDGVPQRSETSVSNSSKSPASRYGGSEYIDHPLALVGHQYMQGGAGEGKQLLGPDGTFENVQVIKTDHAIPSYCDPPNPCPLGFTAEDGCLENFVNSASFSREYQAKQQCSCDNEHSLFNCASPVSTLKGQIYPTTGDNQDKSDTEDEFNELTSPTSLSLNSISLGPSHGQQNKLDTLARTIQNRFGSLESVRNLIEKHEQEMANNYNQDMHLSRVAKKAPRDEANYRY